jgi:hypothetical protein
MHGETTKESAEAYRRNAVFLREFMDAHAAVNRDVGATPHRRATETFTTRSGAAAPAAAAAAGYRGLAVGTAPSGAAAAAAAAAVAEAALPASEAAVLPIDFETMIANGWWPTESGVAAPAASVVPGSAGNEVTGSFTVSSGMLPLSVLDQTNGVIKLDTDVSAAFEPKGYTPASLKHGAVTKARLSNVRVQVWSSAGLPFTAYPDIALRIDTIPASAARTRVTGIDQSSAMAFAHAVVTPSDTPQTIDLGDVSNGVEHDADLHDFGVATSAELADDIGDVLRRKDGSTVFSVRLGSRTAAALLKSQAALGVAYTTSDLVDPDPATGLPTNLVAKKQHVDFVQERLTSPAYSDRLVDLTTCTLRLARTDGKKFTDSTMFTDHKLPEKGALELSGATRGGFDGGFTGRARDAMATGMIRVSAVVTQTVVFPGAVSGGGGGDAL